MVIRKPGIVATLTALSTSPAEVISRIQGLKKDLSSAIAHFGAVGTTSTQSKRWRSHIPALSRTCADIVALSPKLFPKIAFTPDELRAAEEEVRALGELLAFLHGAVTTVNEIYMTRREQLAAATQVVVDQVNAVHSAPLTDDERRVEASDAKLLIDQIVAPVQAAVQSTKAKNANLKSSGEEVVEDVAKELAAARDEIRVLRGEPLIATPAVKRLEVAPAAAKRSRRRNKR
jgi:hypothetical protein